jgi:hypothetical protein
MYLDSKGVPQALCESPVVAAHWPPFFNSAILSLLALYIRWNSQSSRTAAFFSFTNTRVAALL